MMTVSKSRHYAVLVAASAVQAIMYPNDTASVTPYVHAMRYHRTLEEPEATSHATADTHR